MRKKGRNIDAGELIASKLENGLVVASASAIKINAVKDALCQSNQIEVDDELVVLDVSKTKIGHIEVSSDVAEQPVGVETFWGAFNRLSNATKQVAKDVAVIAIENGIFRVDDKTYKSNRGNFNHISARCAYDRGVNLDTNYKKSGLYVDRSVVAIKTPGSRHPATIFASATNQVEFPAQWIEITHSKTGGFKENTVGSVLFSEGIVGDKQDPHTDLTDGQVSRNQQMVTAILETLVVHFSR